MPKVGVLGFNKHAVHAALGALSRQDDVQLTAQLNAIACVYSLCIMEASMREPGAKHTPAAAAAAGVMLRSSKATSWCDAAKQKRFVEVAACSFASALKVCTPCLQVAQGCHE